MNEELAAAVMGRLTEHPGTWHSYDQLRPLAPVTEQRRVGYAHELDDADTPGPSWAFGHDATGPAARQPTGTVSQPNDQLLGETLIALVKAGRVESRDRGSWTEFRVA